MCLHCLNRVPGGCVHCRDEKLENARRTRQQRRRLTDAQRREYGLVAGRLYTPPGLLHVRSVAAAPTRNRDQRGPAQFGSSVLPANFTL